MMDKRYSIVPHVDVYTWQSIISHLDRFTKRFVITLVSKKWREIAKETDDDVIMCRLCKYSPRGASSGSMWRIFDYYSTHRKLDRRPKNLHHKCFNYTLTDFRKELCRQGNAKLVRDLHREGVQYQYPCVKYAMMYGHVNLLKFFHSVNVPLTLQDNAYDAYGAAMNGALDTFRWFKSQDLYVNDEKISKYAAEGGHVHILQWLQDNGFKISDDIAKVGASYGHQHIVLWAALNGYKIDVYVICVEAILQEYYEICGLFGINFLTTKMFGHQNYEKLLGDSISHDDMKTVKYLIACGMQCPPLHTVDVYTPDMIRYLIDNGSFIDIDKCIKRGCWKNKRIAYVRKYAKQHGYAFIDTIESIYSSHNGGK